MAEYNGDDQDFSRYLLKFNSKLSWWKKSLFSIFRLIYKCPKIDLAEKHYKKYFFYFSRLVIALQYTSLVWESNVSITDWKDFNYVWKAIQYCRLDVIFTEIYLTQVYLVLVYSFYSITFILTAVIVSSKLFRNYKMPKSTYFLGKLLTWAELLDTAFVAFLMLVFKYSWTHTEAVEYTVDVSIDYSTLGIFMSLGCLGVAFTIEIFSALFDYDCRHIQALASIKNKANSIPDLYCAVTLFLSVGLYAFVSSYNFVVYRVLLAVLHGVIALFFFYYLPYYNFYANFATSLPHAFVFSSCCIMLAGYSIDDAFFCVLGLIFLSPLTACIWYFTLKYRVSKIKFYKIRTAKSIWEFELAIREKLLNYNEDESEMILKKFNKFRLRDRKRKISVVWEVSFYFFNCRKERVALIKLNQETASSIEEDYQTYLIAKDMKKVAFKNFEEYKLICKLKKIEKVKKIDKKVCIEAYNFYKYLLSLNTPLKLLENSAIRLEKKIKKLEKKYSNLFSKYQDSFILIDLYSSFLEFYGETEKSIIISSKREVIENLIRIKQSSNLIEQNPLMLVSATDFDLGKIKYCNKELSSILQLTQANINERIFTDFFPSSIKILSLESLKNFKSNLLSSTVYIEDNLFILNSKGFLIEVFITIILVGFYKKLFLFSIKKLIIEREACLIHKKKILYYSEKLENLLGIKDFRGYRVENLLNVDLKEFKTKEKVKICINMNTLLLSYKKIKINDETLKILHIYKSKEDYKRTVSILALRRSNVLRQTTFREDEEFFFNERKENKGKIDWEVEPSIELESKAINHFEYDLGIELEKNATISCKSSSSKGPLRRIGLCTDQSLRSIKYFKRILLFSVIYKQIITIILSNCGILVYVSLKIESLISDNSTDILGQTYYSIVDLAYIIKLAQLNPDPNITASTIFPVLNSTKSFLESLLNNYTNFNSEWDNCREAQVLFQDTIPVLLVRDSIKANQAIQAILQQNYDFYDESYILMSNSFGKASMFIKNVLDKVVQSQVAHAVQLSSINLYIIIIGMGIQGICLLSIIPFILFVQNRMNLLWNLIKNYSKKDSDSLGNSAISRLEVFHSTKYYDIHEIEISKTPIHFNYIIKYVLTLSIFLVIGSIFYLVSNYIFYSKFNSLLASRPKLLNNLIQVRLLSIELEFWISSVLGKDYQDFTTLYPDYMPINNDYMTEINNKADLLIDNAQALLNPDYLQLIGTDLFDSYFVGSTSNIGILRYSNYPAIQNLIFESYFLLRDSLTDIKGDFTASCNNFETLGMQTELFLQKVYFYSKNFVIEYLQYFTISSCLFSGLLLILYFIFYYSFFRLEEEKTKSINFISKIMVSSTYNEEEKSNK